MGSGLRGSFAETSANQKRKRPRRDLLDRVLQAQQRAGLPAVQVRAPVRHQQHRPPGAHLPFDHRRRHRQYLGLRRDDQLVQRRAELQVPAVLRLERGRGAPGVDAAHAARQGERLQGDRGRSALYPHRGEGRQVRARALGQRRGVPLRPALSRVQERLGGQGVHPEPRLRHGQGPGRGDGQVHAAGGGGRDRRARSRDVRGGEDPGREPSRLHHLGDGPEC